MATLKWALTCQRIITDNELNTVSYIDAIESIMVSAIPIQLPPIMLATVWERDTPDEAIMARLRVSDPMGEELGTIPVSLDAPGKTRHRANFEVLIMAVHEGDYVFVVEQFARNAWRQEASVSVEIGLLPAEDKSEVSPHGTLSHSRSKAASAGHATSAKHTRTKNGGGKASKG